MKGERRHVFRDSVRGGTWVRKSAVWSTAGLTLDENSWKKDTHDQLQTGLLPILQRLRVLWTAAAEELPHLIRDNLAADETFLEILGTTADTQRRAGAKRFVSDDVVHNVPLIRNAAGRG